MNRLAVIHNGLDQINGSLGYIRAALGGVVVGNNHLLLILVHDELISGLVDEIHTQIVQFGAADLA